MKLRDWLEGLPVRRTPKIIDGKHPRTAPADEEEVTPDLLPLPASQNGHGGHPMRSILVAVGGCELDREVTTLACKVAKEKNARLFAVYGIEVPRTLAIDDELPEQTERAHQALERAAEVAERAGVELESEVVQSRHFGHSLVDEASLHDCALLIMGLPYKQGVGGQIQGAETLDYVLKNALCKVWVVRGSPPEKAAQRVEPVERTLAVR
ncbi:MAG TPA: universal stress protein [Ktedonobacterales bacterium]